MDGLYDPPGGFPDHFLTCVSQVYLVLDNAGWHKSACLNWHHIKPVYLSPYSPDFNPIERLWQHVKGQPMADFLTNDGEALTTRLLDSLKNLLES